MGILRWVFNHEQSFEQGVNWADRVFENEEYAEPEEVAHLAQEYSSDPQAFYNGYRSEWNGLATLWNKEVAKEEKRGFWSGLFG